MRDTLRVHKSQHSTVRYSPFPLYTLGTIMNHYKGFKVGISRKNMGTMKVMNFLLQSNAPKPA